MCRMCRFVWPPPPEQVPTGTTLCSSTKEDRAYASWESSQMAEEAPNFTRVPGSSLHEPGFEMTAGSEAVHDFGDATDAQQDRETKYPAGNSSAAGAVANFVNTIVGAGIIGLPFSIAQSGLGAGVILLCLAAALTFQATTMLINAGEKTGRLNYEELVATVFGKTGSYAFCFFAGVFAFGAMSAYLVVVGDTVPQVLFAAGLLEGTLAERNWVIFVVGAFFVLPVSLLRDLSKLSFTSCVSVLSDLVLTFIVIIAGAGEASENPRIDRSDVYTFIRPTVFAGFGAISFAFVCQHSSFLVYRSMAKGGSERWAGVSRWSVSIALVMGLTLALGGYLSFANETQGNILNNFPPGHAPANFARAFLAVTMIFTYPVEMYVARHVLDVAIFQTLLGKGPRTSHRHFWITVLIWSGTMILALATSNLGSILEIFGAFAGSAIGFIMPPTLHIKLHEAELREALALWKKDAPEYNPVLGERLRALRSFYIPVFMVVFGVFMMIAGVATAALYELSQTSA